MTHHFPKAILFDMGDAILAYSHKTDHSWRVVCNRFASRLENIEPEALLGAIKASAALYWSEPERHRKVRLHLDLARQEIVAGALCQLERVDSALAHDIALAYAVQREEAIVPF